MCLMVHREETSFKIGSGGKDILEVRMTFGKYCKPVRMRGKGKQREREKGRQERTAGLARLDIFNSTLLKV